MSPEKKEMKAEGGEKKKGSIYLSVSNVIGETLPMADPAQSRHAQETRPY